MERRRVISLMRLDRWVNFVFLLCRTSPDRISFMNITGHMNRCADLGSFPYVPIRDDDCREPRTRTNVIKFS
ncbi:hypothetical protein CCUS01_05537 [Colletotrichum cuscutae]|uniref:Uncharacterized protein n=1 Tax=Colletotrichum cuscutae TaxID=1209917 RepID=A0AAI9V6W5_9PEZI|nr:hypothetical protein CCUS01_05537 [Colletotrichum cuscutae]